MTEIGPTLREARQRAKLDVSEVEGSTKIRAKYLRAIENEEWGLLPGPAYVKSFLRTYADELGLDGKLLVEEYKLRHERPSDLDLQPISAQLGADRPRSRAARPPSPPRIPRGVLAGLAVLAALVIFAAIGSSTNKSTPTSKTKHPPGAAKTAPADQAAAQRRAAAQARAQRRRALARQRVRLSLTAGTAVRVCLVNAAGKKVLSGVLTPLSKPKAQVSKRFRITIGIGALTLRWAGKTLRKPSGPGPLGYELDPGGKHKTLPASQRPVCP